MIHKFSKIIAKQSGVNIVKWTQRFQYILLVTIIVLLLLEIYIGSLDDFSFSFLIICIIFGLLCYVFVSYMGFIFSPYTETINIVLFEQIDLDKYIEILETLSKKIRKSQQQVESGEVLLLSKAQVAYLTGDFKTCLDMLDRFQLDLIPKTRQASYRNGATYYRLMCLLQQKKMDEVEELLEKLENNKEQVEAIIAISKGEITTYFDTWEPQWRLEKISKAYNQGRNFLNQGKTTEAKKCFASIVNENSQLFIVRRAKKYMEELS